MSSESKGQKKIGENFKRAYQFFFLTKGTKSLVG